MEGEENAKGDSESRSLFDEPFYFESDALALRGNSDYSALLKSLILLQAQRTKACQDLEKLMILKDNALKEPVEFISSIVHQKSNNTEENSSVKTLIPQRQSVYLLPEINWDKYYEYVDLNNEDMIKNESLFRKHESLRRAARTKNSMSEAPKQSSRQAKIQENKEKKIENYNKSWGVEEQRRLEELLIEFPPEDNEAARWRKIATKLGTRTPLQVQSHCQKYFIKLAKAGLPVPGRMPNLKTYSTKKSYRGGRAARGGGVRVTSDGFQKRIVGRGTTLNEISSMWSSFNPPITMNEEHEAFDEDDDEDFNDEENEEELNEDSQQAAFEDCNEDNNSNLMTASSSYNHENSHSESAFVIKSEPYSDNEFK